MQTADATAMTGLQRGAPAPPPTCGTTCQSCSWRPCRAITLPGLLLLLLLLLGVSLLLQHFSHLLRRPLIWQPQHLLLRLRHQQLSTSWLVPEPHHQFWLLWLLSLCCLCRGRLMSQLQPAPGLSALMPQAWSLQLQQRAVLPSASRLLPLPVMHLSCLFLQPVAQLVALQPPVLQ
jgi:hypothetical protein